MSAAAATADAAPAGGGKKKLIIIIVVAVLVLALAGVGALLLLKKKPVDDEDAEATPKGGAKTSVKHDPKKPPVYVPLDMFVVNLADRETERYAQVGVTLEFADAKEGESLKAFLPAVRSNILMVLAHKTSAELLGREGKQLLAKEVMYAAARATGIEIEPPAAEQAEDEEKPKKKKKKKAAEPVLPITAVHFSTFIVQ